MQKMCRQNPKINVYCVYKPINRADAQRNIPMKNITLNTLTLAQITLAAKMSEQKLENVLKDIFGDKDFDRRDAASMEALEAQFQEELADNDGDAECALSCLIDYRAGLMPDYYA